MNQNILLLPVSRAITLGHVFTSFAVRMLHSLHNGTNGVVRPFSEPVAYFCKLIHTILQRINQRLGVYSNKNADTLNFTLIIGTILGMCIIFAEVIAISIFGFVSLCCFPLTATLMICAKVFNIKERRHARAKQIEKDLVSVSFDESDDENSSVHFTVEKTKEIELEEEDLPEQIDQSALRVI